jgi:Spy/CpxP family protein refolding chaperone
MQITKRKTLIAGLSLLTALPILAWQGGPPPARRLDYLAGYLSLTDSQKTQAQTIFTASETAAETVRGQAASAHSNLQTAVKANASDAEIDKLAATIGALDGQLTAIRAKAEAKFYALLTAEQKAKYEEMRGPGGPGGPGGRGPNGRGRQG